MQKLSQTEELARTLAARARHHALTPEQISRAMDEQDYDVAQLDELYTALEDRGVHLTEEEADQRINAPARRGILQSRSWQVLENDGSVDELKIRPRCCFPDWKRCWSRRISSCLSENKGVWCL